MYSRRRTSAADAFADPFIMVVAVCLLLVIWLAAQAAHLVCTAFAKQPQNKALWTTLLLWLGSVLGLILVALATRGGSRGGSGQTLIDALGAVVAVTTVFLLVVCRSVTISSQQLVSPPKETLVTRVLRRSWWERLDAVA